MTSSTDLSRESSQDGLSRNPSQDSLPTPSSVLSATDLTPTASKTVPRHQLTAELSGLYSEIIAAKLWKVAEEYLNNGVSLPPDVLLRLSHLVNYSNRIIRTLHLITLSGLQKMERLQDTTIPRRSISGRAAFSPGVCTAF